MTDALTEPDAWTGGSVELLLRFGDPEAAARALAVAWTWSPLNGPYESNQAPSPRDAELLQQCLEAFKAEKPALEIDIVG